MKTCEKCTVTVTGGFEKCPLCQNTLNIDNQSQNENENVIQNNETFPFIPLVKHKHNLLFRFIQFFSFVAVIISVVINAMVPQSGLWSLFVVAGVACVWFSVAVAVRKRRSILKNLAYQVTIICILSVLWDVVIGWRGWSVDFVIPIAFVAAMSTTAIIARILKLKTQAFIIYSFVLMIYGVIPIIFVLTGLCKIIYPSMICVAISLISFAALIIFEGRNMSEELKRRLHI
ncbi:MAG: DUF6320 domain-containing protein [Oscillospiraceae bacterium]|nr:DUF6320 domain-containing protein [Oscillospiraceae bacterium]